MNEERISFSWIEKRFEGRYRMACCHRRHVQPTCLRDGVTRRRIFLLGKRKSHSKLKFVPASSVLPANFTLVIPTVDTILSVNRKFAEIGVAEDLSRSGPPLSVLSEEKLEELEKLVINNPILSVRQGAAQAAIIQSTYQRAMKKLNFKPYRPTLKVQLNEDDFDRRSEFCETWLIVYFGVMRPNLV